MIVNYAVITDEVSQDLDEVLDFCLRHGIRGVEIRSVWGRPPLDLSDDDVARIRARCDEAGVMILGFDSPVGKVEAPVTGDALAVERERLSRSIDLAEQLGAAWIRVFTFLKDPDLDRDRLAALLNELYGDHLGPELLFETGTETNSPTATATATLLRQSDLGRRPQVLWDPGNTLFAGHSEKPSEALDALGDLLGHVHVKDPLGTERYVAVGDGHLDWSEIVNLLDQAGYEGWLSLETHYRVDRELTAQERRYPWGTGFSVGGAEATSRCLAGLRGAVMGETGLVSGLDHFQIAIPGGREHIAEHFYGRLLGLQRIPKPSHLAARGGCWFQGEGFQLHLGVEEPFSPAKKAHPGFLVGDLTAARTALESNGFATAVDQPLDGYDRCYLSDPFGNRIELLQRLEPENP